MVVDDDGISVFMAAWQMAAKGIRPPILIVDDEYPNEESMMMEAMAASRRSATATPHVPGGELLLQAAIVQLGAPVPEGVIVEAVAIAWDALARELTRDPMLLHRFDWRKMEEIIAAAYHSEGFNVVLTPRSGDGGRDVIATRPDRFSIRILDQVKKYKTGYLVAADDVRALLGVLSSDLGASKGIVTTTSDFAPRIRNDPSIAPFLPHRLDLRTGHDLRAWISDLARKHGR